MEKDILAQIIESQKKSVASPSLSSLHVNKLPSTQYVLYLLQCFC